MAGTGIWGWVFAWPVTAGTGVNGLIVINNSTSGVLTVNITQLQEYGTAEPIVHKPIVHKPQASI